MAVGLCGLDRASKVQTLCQPCTIGPVLWHSVFMLALVKVGLQLCLLVCYMSACVCAIKLGVSCLEGAVACTWLLCSCTGSGRRVGENCEQLWAQLRPVTKHTRYMSKDNYVFVLDDALLLVADEKMGSFVAFLCNQHKANKKKLGGYSCAAFCSESCCVGLWQHPNLLS